MLLGDDTTALQLVLRGLVAGAAIGAAQAVLLRRILPTAAVVTLGWAIGWVVSAATGLDLAPKWAVFGAKGALTFQLATGLTLAYLLRQPARDLAPAPAHELGPAAAAGGS